MKIGNTFVDINHADIKKAKSIDDLKKLDLFKDDKDYAQLWEAIKPKGNFNQFAQAE